MSARIRDDLQHLGLVERGAEASLRDGAKASVGDLIVTRKNDHELGIANGNAWRVEKIDGETITMRRMLDADRETGERRFADDTVTYKAAKDWADLAYAEQPGRTSSRRPRGPPTSAMRSPGTPARAAPSGRATRCSPATKTATGHTRR